MKSQPGKAMRLEMPRGNFYGSTDPAGFTSDIPVVTTPIGIQATLGIWIENEATPLLLVPAVARPILPSSPEITIPIEHNDDAVIKEKPGQGLSQDEIRTDETSWSIACQVFVPFMIAGFGTVGAGLLLDFVQHWTVFQTVPEMFVLVPALLGLKGNLEMTLASRISTQANLGLIDSKSEQWKLAFGNLSLLQCQSLVLGLVASLLASLVGWAREGEFNLHNALLLSSSSLMTASAASLILGSLTIFVVIISRKFNINPDNVAAPVAASLGDVVTLALLASFASLQFSLASNNDNYLWVEGSILMVVAVLIPMWALLAYRCQYTRQVLYSGWIPVISAVAISSGGGYILNFAVATFKGIAACQPVINGVGGNLVAVQACRISTFLHQNSTRGVLPKDDESKPCISPCKTWFGKSVHARTARILMLMAIPGHVIFISCVHVLKNDQSHPLSAEFVFIYLAAALLQVAILLYIAHCLVHALWRFGFDPDDAAIPYLTALGDLLGTALLYVAFLVIETI